MNSAWWQRSSESSQGGPAPDDVTRSTPSSLRGLSLPTRHLLAVLSCAVVCLSAGCDGDGGDTTSNFVNNTANNTPNNHSPDAGMMDGGDVEVVLPPERALGERAPLTRECDSADSMRCLLPWPSDRFTQADSDTETGLRLKVNAEALIGSDDASPLERADGFSRVNPVITAFDDELDAETLGQGVDAAVQLIVAEPGDHFGERVSLRVEAFSGPGAAGGVETALVAYPQVPMRPSTEYAVVVLNRLKRADGGALEADRHARVVLGLEAPGDDEEAALWATHAPARQAMEVAGVSAAEVVRTWSFTTRSRRDPLRDMDVVRQAMLDAVEAGEVAVAIDSVDFERGGGVAMVVQGRLTGLPSFLTEQTGFRRDAQGRPQAEGTREFLFRVAVPSGEGDYRAVMYSHGLGGDVSDGAFDELIAGSNGACKVGIQFDGWTQQGIFDTFENFFLGMVGVERIPGMLVENIAGGIAVQMALGTVIGDALSAPTIAGQDNPTAGRRPTIDDVIWAGGSLGGSMGLIYGSVEPSVRAAVINVPGAGLTHYLRFSNIYEVGALVLEVVYPTDLDTEHGLAIAQTVLDPGDGANYAGSPAEPAPVFLIQQSIGDPVMPNIGTDLVATSTGALHLGEVLRPVVGLTSASRAEGANALTQYKVVDEGQFAVHGFADRDTPAGRAALEQIAAFIRSYWDTGTPVITLPSGCVDNTPAMSCDFSQVPDNP